MKYPLQQLDHFVYKTLQPQVLINSINNGTYTCAVWNNALFENENVKMFILERFAVALNQSDIPANINNTHTGCINLAATLSAYITTFQSLLMLKAQHQQVISNYLQLQKKIQGLLCFLEENFATHITTFKLTDRNFKHASLHEINLRFCNLKAKLQQHCKDEVLLHIATNYAENFLNEPVLNIHNYQRFLYLKEYIYRLEKLPFNNKANNITQELRNCLLLLNYNKFSLVRYIMQQLKMQIDEIETTTGKISQWHLYLKEFKQLQHTPQDALFPSSPSLKKLITKNIREAILR